MFSKVRTASRDVIAADAKSSPPSIISADMRVTGDITSDGEVQIDGNIEGDVRCQSLTVGTTGSVKGEVEVDKARVHGSMTGQIRANSVFIASSARIMGDITHESLAIEPGAYVDGHCRHMTQKEKTDQDKSLLLEDSSKHSEPSEPSEPSAPSSSSSSPQSQQSGGGFNKNKGDRSPQEAARGLGGKK